MPCGGDFVHRALAFEKALRSRSVTRFDAEGHDRYVSPNDG
jgi:hypothetical protein